MTDQPYGPNSDAVAAHIEKIKTLTPEQVKAFGAAWEARHVRDTANAARSAAKAALEAALEAALVKLDAFVALGALDASLDVSSAWDAWSARSAAWYAALALLAHDLITEEQFDLLYGPWASVMEQEASNE